MRRFVVGDIHGGYKALVQALERAGFDHENDLLISLGDVVDGWPDSKRCIEFLYGLPHRVWVRGNHDQWFIDWCDGKGSPPVWTQQGGAATLESFAFARPVQHLVDFAHASTYLYELDDMVFIHGGFRPDAHPQLEIPDTLMWDRSLMARAHREFISGHDPQFGRYRRIFLGHTTVTRYGLTEPAQWGNVVGMDTGGGWEGRLSVMDIDSGEFWQSDQVDELYAGIPGRWAGAVILKA